jgi:large conductance mechanosensitive channel
MISEFRAFLTKSNALALAIGVIIGAAIGKVVTALADDLLMPVIGLLLPGADWRDAKVVLKTTTDAAGKVKESALLYGHFLGTVIDFVLIALIVFFITKALLKTPKAPEKTKKCPECLETIPEAARRCRACTTVLG